MLGVVGPCDSRRHAGGRAAADARRRRSPCASYYSPSPQPAIAAAAFSVPASARASDVDSEMLRQAETIRAELDARYRRVPGQALAVTEATTTGVVESFTLLTPDLLEARVVPAANGIYFAICPARATCPYPARRFSRRRQTLLPACLALELALRTFLETSATVVAVLLPTRSCTTTPPTSSRCSAGGGEAAADANTTLRSGVTVPARTSGLRELERSG